MNYLALVAGWVATNVLALGVGAALGYWFGPSVVSYLQSLLKKIA